MLSIDDPFSVGLYNFCYLNSENDGFIKLISIGLDCIKQTYLVSKDSKNIILKKPTK